MNGILSNNNPENKLQGILCSKSKESVETAGSLAFGLFHSLFDAECYDEFLSSNPFVVDYSLYSDCGDCVAYSGFLSSFANAFSTLGSFDGNSTFSSAGGGDFGGSCSSCGCSGGFTSVC